MADDQALIRQVYATSVTALNAGDIAALEACYTQDAIQLPPNGPPLEGWPAIRSSLENELKGLAIEARVDVVEVVIAGVWAYARGDYTITAGPRGAVRRSVTSGSWLDILRREADGSWRIARSTWSDYGTDG